MCIALCLISCSCEIYDTLSTIMEPKKGIVEDVSLGYTLIDSTAFTYSPHYKPYVSRDSYNRLENDSMRKLYNMLYTNVYHVYPKSFSDSEYKTKQVILEEALLSQAQIRLTIKALTDDNPHIFWVSTTFGYLVNQEENYTAVQLYSRMSPKKLTESMNALKEKVNGFFASLKADMTAYQLELYIHDYILKTCEYDENTLDVYTSMDMTKTNSFDPYGVLVNGLAVCEGYARTFQMLCNGVGIRCINVIGESHSELHMWNAVQLDGDWYYVDTTWDDNNEKSFMYDYFNINEKQLTVDHEFSPLNTELTDEEICGDDKINALTSNFYIPKCTETAFNYYVRESVHLESYDSDDVTNSLMKAASEKADCFHIYIDPKEFTFDYAVDQMFFSYPQYFFQYVDSVNNSLTDYSIDVTNLSLYQKEALSSVTVVLNYI